ncbi:Uncharacterized protein Adt_49069 [Abeliophyllum distichum]|uniref:Uncharacterized protein n=1 Tax=Abeliophyllum distichum TaxID=126358 RepID=A0ABD1NP87_9LAMI
MVRLVFRPYTQVRRTICTSVSLRASTRVSSGFAPLRHSSPSFGSRQVCSHSNPSQKIKVGRRCTPQGDHANQLPCALRVYSPVDSHTCQTPWSVFQDGSNGEPAGQHREHADAEARLGGACCPPQSGRRHSTSISTARALAAASIRAGPRPESIGRPAHRRSTSDRDASPTPIRFPPDNFKHSLTLFSKFFSSFPSRYLFAIGLSPVFSLGRNLPPDWGCIPKQPDSPTAPRGAAGSEHNGALTLSGAPFQGTWARSAAEDASPDYNSNGEAARFSSWAFPRFASPLLGESL